MVSKSALAIVAALGFAPVLWFSGYVIGASGQGEANSASPAQAADAPIEATKLGFLDLDAVLRADKRLKADLDRIKIALADAELSLEKDHGAAPMDLERKVKNQRAGEPEWMKALQERTTKHIERIDEIAATKSDAVVERDRVLKQALDRIDAAVV
ncbi:MAG: hypothetical protein KDB07_12530, partial [Planctomycetes bacterium]|nr:hypothetical protein [Planctomycetota bacterium]